MAENRRLRKEVEALIEINDALQSGESVTMTVARHYHGGDMDCDGDGSGPGCENDVMWEIQAMDASGSHYSYVCSEHLDYYQKWADEDGRSPMVFEGD